MWFSRVCICNNQLENIRAVLNVASGTGEVRIEGVLSKDLLDYTVLRRLTYEADGHRYAAKLQGASMLFCRIKGYTVIPPTPVALKKESWRVYITLPDFFENRFKDKRHILRVTSGIFIVIFFLVYTAAQL